MARDIFLDAGVRIAISDTGDQHRATASEFSRQISRECRPLVTTNLAFVESNRLILYVARYHSAIRFLGAVDCSIEAGPLRLKCSLPDLEADAKQILSKYYDHKRSAIDVVSSL